MENLHDGWIFLGFTEATGSLLGTGKYVALYENANGSRVWKHCNEKRLIENIEKMKKSSV